MPSTPILQTTLTEIFNSLPKEFGKTFYELSQETKEQNPPGVWPKTPYHYGMGRIKAYEEWRDSLNPKELEEEITRCRKEHTDYEQKLSQLLCQKLNEHGIDVSFYIAEWRAKGAHKAKRPTMKTVDRKREPGPDGDRSR